MNLGADRNLVHVYGRWEKMDPETTRVNMHGLRAGSGNWIYKNHEKCIDKRATRMDRKSN